MSIGARADAPAPYPTPLRLGGIMPGVRSFNGEKQGQCIGEDDRFRPLIFVPAS